MPRGTQPRRVMRAVLWSALGIGALLVVLVAFGVVQRKLSPTAALAGQSNLRMTFYGRAVDENGKGLAGVNFDFQIEAYPADWSFETRGRDYVRSTASAVSDTNGNFQFEVNGAMLRLRTTSIGKYRELFELDGGTRRDDEWNSVFTRAISLISWGEQQYRSDPKRPAVFVFISPGAQTTSALPSRGGFRSQGRNRWIENRSAWPHEPSLDDVDWANGPPRRNVSVPLVFKAVDTDGHPIAGVQIAYEVERYRTLQEMRSDHYNAKSRTKSERGLVTTGSDGTARATANGFRFKSIYNVQLQGTKWGEGPSPIIGVSDGFYVRDFVDQSGNLIFRCDDENPMTLVMARRDEQVSHALPSRGGYRKGGEGDSWQRIEPEWPEGMRRPIKYLAPVPATAPAAAAATRPGG